MPANHRMLEALTLRGLESERCEDGISARIKWGEIVESPYGTVGKANSSANWWQMFKPENSVWEFLQISEKKDHHGME